MKTGSVLRRIRQEHGLTQIELAKKTGIDVTTIRKYEGGKHTVSEKSAKIFAEVFDVSPNVFLLRDLKIESAMHMLFQMYTYFGGDFKQIKVPVINENGQRDEDYRTYISFEALEPLIRAWSNIVLPIERYSGRRNKEVHQVLDRFPKSFDSSDNNALAYAMELFDEWLETGEIDDYNLRLQEYASNLAFDDRLANELIAEMNILQRTRHNSNVTGELQKFSSVGELPEKNR